MPAMVIFHLLLLFLLRVASSSCSLVVLILLPLLLLPIEIEMRKGRSLAPCSSGGGEGNEEDGRKMDGRGDLDMGLERK
ncbi:hypothetical protein PVK06_016449 [Gossypium arboreum]|uniref:Secreted protein n=1 Tax=Gossypium arboreum TaxID=29729 RepID=A0ABR0Q071_GOSAR|nr:hypothetical protein PVK06_016449 [Gossypium arboreum]